MIAFILYLITIILIGQGIYILKNIRYVAYINRTQEKIVGIAFISFGVLTLLGALLYGTVF
jgi:hypothetical protein